ncbi:MAG: DUF4043 family protein [Geminicoccaceae bacterium]
MADSTAATGLTVQQWDDKFFTEYVRENRFRRFMGTNENSIIQVKEDLTVKKGKTITYALVNRLTGAGVTGSATLEGNEEDMDSRSFALVVDKIRNGVRVAEIEEQYSAISLRNAARSVLKTWMMEETRDDIIGALGSINGVAYGTATEVQKDAWIVDNADRVLFGALVANSGVDHSVALATIDNTADKLTSGVASLAKRLALTASPKIRPVRTTEDEQWFVMFCNSLAFRDLQADTTIQQANREAWVRGANNPLFTGGDLMYDGIIFKEIEDIAVISGVGAGAIDVAPNYLCGAQAVALGWAKRTTSKDELFDYGDKQGVAIEEIRGIDKMIFGSGAGDTDDTKDNGLVTVYTAGVGDA